VTAVEDDGLLAAPRLEATGATYNAAAGPGSSGWAARCRRAGVPEDCTEEKLLFAEHGAVQPTNRSPPLPSQEGRRVLPHPMLPQGPSFRRAMWRL
jgi:hypothetical protein